MSDDFDWDDDESDESDPNDYWSFFYEGIDLRERDVDGGLSKMYQGRDGALADGEARAAFYMNHWILQTLLFLKQDYVTAYDLAVKTAAESGKPIYEDMQERICVFQDLILAHMGIDPLGYADLIEQAIQEMQKRITRPVNCMFCLQDLRCTFEIAQGNLDAAQQATNQYLAMSEDKGDREHYGVSAMARMTEIAYLRGDWERMLKLATVGAQWARTSTSQIEYPPFFEACLALAQRKLGNEDQARQHYRIATNLATAHVPNEVSHYYDLLCDYHEMEGDLKAAANVRDRELEEIAGRGQTYREARVHLDKARLLKQVGQPFDAPLAKAEALIARLKRPDVLAEQINALKA